MICKPCAGAADFMVRRPGVKIPQRLGHNLCKGCCCQHKPIKEGQIQK